MSKKVFHEYCTSALKVLQSQYEATKIIKHNSTVGSIREQIIKDFLSDHLPELVTLMSGQIFDSEGSYSKQQDIVLVLKSTPRLPFSSGIDLIFQDGVIATIEIKTSLNASVLKDIGNNIESVRSLNSSVMSLVQLCPTSNWPSDKILTTIITYGGSSLDKQASDLQQLSDDQKPDLLLDLSQGMLIRNNGHLTPHQNYSDHTRPDYLLIDNPAEGFKRFLIFLTEITGTLSARGIEWKRYL